MNYIDFIYSSAKVLEMSWRLFCSISARTKRRRRKKPKGKDGDTEQEEQENAKQEEDEEEDGEAKKKVKWKKVIDVGDQTRTQSAGLWDWKPTPTTSATEQVKQSNQEVPIDGEQIMPKARRRSNDPLAHPSFGSLKAGTANYFLSCWYTAVADTGSSAEEI